MAGEDKPVCHWKTANMAHSNLHFSQAWRPNSTSPLDGAEKEEAQPTPKLEPKAEVFYKPQEEHSFILLTSG